MDKRKVLKDLKELQASSAVLKESAHQTYKIATRLITQLEGCNDPSNPSKGFEDATEKAILEFRQSLFK